MAGGKLESRIGKTLDELSRADKAAAARSRAKASKGAAAAAVGKKGQRKAGGAAANGAAGQRVRGRGAALAGGLRGYQVLGVRRKIGPKKAVAARGKGGGLANGASKRARAKGGGGKGQKLVRKVKGAGVGAAPGKRKGLGKDRAKGKAWEDASWGAWEQPVDYAPQRRSRGRGLALWRGVGRGRLGALSSGAAKGKGRGRGRGLAKGVAKGYAKGGQGGKAGGLRGVRRTIGGGARKGGAGAGIFYAALGKGKSRGKALGGKAAYGGKANGGGPSAKGKGRPAPAALALTNGGYAKGAKGYAKGGGAGYAKGGGGGGGKGNGPSAARSIFFSGADLATPSSELLGHFERVGDVSNFRLLTSPDGRSRGRGICEFTKVYMAEEAIGRLDGTIVDGRLLTVRYYEP